MDAHERFEALVDEFGGTAGVERPGTGRGFGSSALKTGGSIFAMVSADRLVVKLPPERVRELVAAGEGASFDAGKGRPMRQWVVVLDDDQASRLAAEALAYVASSRRG